MSTEENLSTMIVERNSLLKNYFSKSIYDFEVVDFDINCPFVIWRGKFKIFCYVKNFDLIFTSGEKSKEIVKIIKLRKNLSPDDDFLRKYLHEIEHKEVFKIEYDNTGLYLSGYNFVDKANKQHKYPVFSKRGYKVYFDKAKAESIAMELNFDYEDKLHVS